MFANLPLIVQYSIVQEWAKYGLRGHLVRPAMCVMNTIEMRLANFFLKTIIIDYILFVSTPAMLDLN